MKAERSGPPLIVIISGPSGVGKDRVIEELQGRGYPCHYTVTATSRPPRPGEVPGVSYFLYEPAEFERRIAADFFIEYSRVYDRHYGVPRDQIEAALATGLDVIIKPDVQGAVKLRGLLPEAVSIFLAPESIDQLADRLRRRGSELPAEFNRRLETARHELVQADSFDYLVINREGQLDATLDTIEAILRAEKCRVRRLRPVDRLLLKEDL